MAETNPNQKPESSSNQPRLKTWGQRAEVVLLGGIGTAAGVGIRDIVKHFVSKAADQAAAEPVRRAAAFGRGLKLRFG